MRRISEEAGELFCRSNSVEDIGDSFLEVMRNSTSRSRPRAAFGARPPLRQSDKARTVPSRPDFLDSPPICPQVVRRHVIPNLLVATDLRSLEGRKTGRSLLAFGPAGSDLSRPAVSTVFDNARSHSGDRCPSEVTVARAERAMTLRGVCDGERLEGGPTDSTDARPGPG